MPCLEHWASLTTVPYTAVLQVPEAPSPSHAPVWDLRAQACEVPDHKVQVLVAFGVRATQQAWGCSSPIRGHACQ